MQNKRRIIDVSVSEVVQVPIQFGSMLSDSYPIHSVQSNNFQLTYTLIIHNENNAEKTKKDLCDNRRYYSDVTRFSFKVSIDV